MRLGDFLRVLVEKEKKLQMKHPLKATREGKGESELKRKKIRKRKSIEKGADKTKIKMLQNSAPSGVVTTTAEM